MHRAGRMLVGLVAAAVATSGCFGPFRLTRKLYQWNEQVSSDKWGREAVFLLLIWVPVYGVAALADGVIFNSIEFWGGDNPIKKSDGPTGAVRIVRDDAEALLMRVRGNEGEELLVRQFSNGQAGEGLRLYREHGQTVAANLDGKVLWRAHTLADGQVLVTDDRHVPLAVYSAQQAGQEAAAQLSDG